MYARHGASARRLSVRLLVCLLLILPPLASLAKPAAPKPTPPTYKWVPNWPVNYGKGVPEWAGADVTGVGIDPAGNIHTCLGTDHPVIVWDPQGHFLRSWGEGTLVDPHTIRFAPNGHIWSTDITLHQVFEFTADYQLIRSWGVRGQPGPDANHFAGPADVAFAPNGDVYIADGHWNNRIFHLDANGNVIGMWGSYGKGPGQFNLPHSVAVDAQSRVWVADRMNKRLEIFTPNGEFIQQWKLPDYPHSLWFTPDQTLYVGGLSGFYAYRLDGTLLASYKRHGRGRGQVYEAHMITVDSHANLFEADAAAKRVQKFSLQ